MIILHAKPVGAGFAGNRGNIMGRINIHFAFKHSCGWIGCKLIHYERICGKCMVGKKQSPKIQCQQMTFVVLHFVGCSNDSQSAPYCQRLRTAGAINWSSNSKTMPWHLWFMPCCTRSRATWALDNVERIASIISYTSFRVQKSEILQESPL